MTLWIAIECIVSQVTKMDEKPLQPVIFRHTKPSFLAHETPVSDTQNPYFRHTESSFSTHRTLVSDTQLRQVRGRLNSRYPLWFNLTLERLKTFSSLS